MKIVVISLRKEAHPPEEFEPLLAAEAKIALGFVADNFFREKVRNPQITGLGTPSLGFFFAVTHLDIRWPGIQKKKVFWAMHHCCFYYISNLVDHPHPRIDSPI